MNERQLCELPSATEVLKRRPVRRSEFGGWRLDRRAHCLVLQAPDAWYEIPLAECRTSAQVLDWILQIAGKTWATPTIVAGLVRALDYYLDPQATLCSFGRERGPIDAVAAVRRRRKDD
jgi:hypothetical protein